MMSYMILKELQEKVNLIDSNEELEVQISHLKILASNNRSEITIIELIKEYISVANRIKDYKSRVILDGLLLLQYVQQPDKFEKSNQILKEMQSLARKINFTEGLAFSHSFSWYIAKQSGNSEKGRYELRTAVQLLEDAKQPDEFIFHFIKYAYAMETWLETRDIKVVEIFENCANYFYKENLHYSLTRTLVVLIIIYQQTQDKEKSMKAIQKILSNYNFIEMIPKEMKALIHYFIGVGHKLNFNLQEALEHLKVSQTIFQNIYDKSIYSGYYVTSLAHITETYALQGQLESASKVMKEIQKIIDEGIALRNIDPFNKQQIKHTLNLSKFYIYSRLKCFQIDELYELADNIIGNIGKLHSNAMFFSEFLLNAKLTKEQLEEIKDLNNPSTRRVEHIINFLIEKTTRMDEKQIMKCISALKKRPVEERMTFTEKAFADLLAAQEYYRINRFAEISPLLRKYENNLHKIEVLEMRVFMEAFIQVGAYKNGDPLGPALQYMAIKKCRLYGFSRLENNLLDYLNMQRNDAQRLLT